MADSNFVFEAGDPIDVGAHGNNELVYASGEPVNDAGESRVVFERGTGLGSGVVKVLIHKNGSNSWGFGPVTNHYDSLERFDAVYYTNADLSSAISNEDPDIVMLMDVEDGANYSISELDAIENVYTSGGGIMSATEDANSCNVSAANDVLEHLEGERPWVSSGDGIDGTSGDSNSNCHTETVPPDDAHPIFEGGGGLHRRVSEAPLDDFTFPYSAVWDDDTNVWAENENTDHGGRVWLEGSYSRFSDNGNDEWAQCSGSVDYVENTAVWLAGQF